MPIEKYSVTLPTIYDEFQCKGGACRNTCCQKWGILLTRSEYNKVRRLSEKDGIPKFVQRIPRKQATDFQYAKVTLNDDGNCPYLTQDSLCGLQIQHGFSALPWICKQFPRYMVLFSDNSFRYALDTGCERVNELLWENAANGLHFKTEMHEITNKYSKLHSGCLAEWEADIQNICIWLMQNRTYSLSDRLILLGLATRELDEIQKNNQPENTPQWFMKWQAQTKSNIFSEMLAESSGDSYWFVSNVLKTCYMLYLTNPKSFDSIYQNLKKTITLQDKINIDNEISEITWDHQQYLLLKENFYRKFPNIEQFLENYLLLNLVRMGFPFQLESCWDTYGMLITYYSLTLFLLITADLQSVAELIDFITYLSRETLNLSTFQNIFLDQLKETDSASLAHLVILIRG